MPKIWTLILKVHLHRVHNESRSSRVAKRVEYHPLFLSNYIFFITTNLTTCFSKLLVFKKIITDNL